MKARYQFRFYPTDQQIRDLSRLFGCVRVVWNDALAACKGSEKLPSYNQLSSLLTQSKQTEERVWLTEVSAVPLQQSVRNLNVAYQNFFNSVNGKRKGKKINPPRFKSRKSKQSATFTNVGFSIKGEKVYLAKIGYLDVMWSRPLPSEPSSVTVIKDAAGRYFLSFVVEINPEKLPDNGKSVGIDLGITDFATLDNGEKIKSPKPLKKRFKKLRKAQRNLSRKQKGSKRREKARLKVAKLHAKIKDIRTDFLHKVSTRLIRENQTIVLEDLNTSGMLKNRKLSRAISDLGWRSFRDMLKAKSERYGRDFRVISRWEPTTQKCSCCGQIGGKKELSVREWTCLFCGETHDRDVNAAKNIKVAGGLSETRNGHRGRRKSSLLVASDEVSTRLLPIQLNLFG
ncbi:MAG: transposase [Woronichinia naegeliana WA131]|jgi:putative transposase|uniref:Transposase n=1 Tax=Woronichinia naegeliana WA131 TaxID=2824559 RepID=A0A977L1P5_9CYAN|nr:MAG: transposase [Woronichinia naegeliana WA131]